MERLSYDYSNLNRLKGISVLYRICMKDFAREPVEMNLVFIMLIKLSF